MADGQKSSKTYSGIAWIAFILGVTAVLLTPLGMGLFIGPVAMVLGIRGAASVTPRIQLVSLLGLLLGLVGIFGSMEGSRSTRQGITGSGTSSRGGVSSPRNASFGSDFSVWVGKEAPNFQVTDLNGNSYNLENLKGKRVMLVFWGTNCPPCLKEIPSLKEIDSILPDDQFQILALSMEEAENLIPAVKELGIPYPVISLASGDHLLQEPYTEVRFLPTLMVISPDGKIEHADVGYTDKDTLLSLARGVHPSG